MLRGRWLLENLLGAPPPPPPPDVPALKENGADGERRIGARADGGAPQEPAARSVTCGWIRSASRSRTSTRSANGARRATARRSMRPRRCPTAAGFEGVAGLRPLLLSHREDFVRTVTRKAAGLRARPRPRVRRPAGRPQDRARRGVGRLPLVVHHHRHRQEHAVQHETSAAARSAGARAGGRRLGVDSAAMRSHAT